MKMTVQCPRCMDEVGIEAEPGQYTVACPTCNLELPVTVSPTPPPLAVPRNEYLQTLDTKTLLLTLKSGLEIRIQEVLMFPSSLIQKTRAWFADAAQKHSGFSTGLGFIGSVGWVLGGSLVTGAVENMINQGLARSGDQSLMHAASLGEEVRGSGLFIPVRHICNLELLDPASWFAPVSIPQRGVDVYILNDEVYFRCKTDTGSICTVLWKDNLDLLRTE